MEIIALIALGLMLISQMTVRQFPDPDMFHEMATWRAALEQGSLPVEDTFAYTPTRVPVVHHEWGTGMVLHWIVIHGGEPGLLALRYTLTGLIAVLCVWCARRRGAGWPAVIMVVPLAVFMGHIGLTTVRAQMFTLTALAALLLLLDVDRRGGRWWILPWLVIYTMWLNLHAGFVVGAAFVGLHWVEQFIRTRTPQWHLIFTGAAMGALMLVNPYGWDFVPFIWESITMQRPNIPEWWPLWRLEGSEALTLYVYVFGALLILYCMLRGGWKSLSGLLIVLLCAYASLRHLRHASLFAVVILCYLPAFVQVTPLGTLLDQLWMRYRKPIGVVFALVGFVCVFLRPHPPWKLYVPVSLEDEKHYGMLYPVSAAAYLREINFHGNVMTPFTSGAYIIWTLYPNVKVSQDGRYEVAYQHGVIEQLLATYFGKEHWREGLEKHPTDLVLVPRYFPLADLMANESNWPRIYRDDAVDIFARPGLSLQAVDRIGKPLARDFPDGT